MSERNKGNIMITMIEEKIDLKDKKTMVECPRCECMFGIETDSVLKKAGYIHINDLWELWDKIKLAMTENQVNHVRYNQIIFRLNKLLSVAEKPAPTYEHLPK